MAARGQNTSASLDVDPALHWHICVHTDGGKGYCPSLTGWLAVRGREVPTVQPGKKQATGCAFFFFSPQNMKGMQTERDEGDKAERKSWAHHRRSDKSRRRRSCLSGRCRGHRPWSGGPRRERKRWGDIPQRVSCLQVPIPTIYLRLIFKISHILLAISMF